MIHASTISLSQSAYFNNLQHIEKWACKKPSIYLVVKGNAYGHGNLFLANKPMQMAVLPVGYSQDYSRMLSNSGNVVANGVKVKVVGTINMNATSVDVTEVEAPNIGDSVFLIGGEGEQEVTVSSFAEMSEQLNYELLTRLPKDLPREIIA